MCFLWGTNWILIYYFRRNSARTVYFSHTFLPLEVHLTLNGRSIPFVIHVKYLGVIFDNRVTWTLHIKMIEAKAFRTFITAYSRFKSERLSTNIKLTLHKAVIKRVMTYACPRLGICYRYSHFEIALLAKQGSPHHWYISKLHIGPRVAHSFPSTVYL
jgi:hypothetical protein